MTDPSEVKIVDSKEAWQMLASDPNTVLVDVRTMVEWAYVGLPDLSELQKDIVTIEWTKMSGQQNPDFVQQLEQVIPQDRVVLFICRAGVRSQAAAIAARHAGYEKVISVDDGFDGVLNEEGQRKTVSGWCAQGLPWTQR
jgi:rhodanese-related sulfurtransferase